MCSSYVHTVKISHTWPPFIFPSERSEPCDLTPSSPRVQPLFSHHLTWSSVLRRKCRSSIDARCNRREAELGGQCLSQRRREDAKAITQELDHHSSLTSTSGIALTPVFWPSLSCPSASCGGVALCCNHLRCSFSRQILIMDDDESNPRKRREHERKRQGTLIHTQHNENSTIMRSKEKKKQQRNTRKN